MPNGWKNWAALETVTEPDFQGYLQDQVVMRFDSAAARDATLGGNVAEGMMCWLKDANTLQYYRSGWKPVGTQRQGYALNTTSQSIPNAQWTKVALQDIRGAANSTGRATWTADGKAKVPMDGTYQVTGMIAYPKNNTGQRCLQVQTSTDGSSFGRGGALIGGSTEVPAASVSTVILSVDASMYLAKDSYVALYTYQDSGAALLANGTGQAGMSLVLLGAD